MLTKLAQLRANKSPLLQSYLHTVNPDTYIPQSPLCLTHTHDTNRLFNGSQVPIQHNTTRLWKKPLEAAMVIRDWESRLTTFKVKTWLLQDILGGGTTTTFVHEQL